MKILSKREIYFGEKTLTLPANIGQAIDFTDFVVIRLELDADLYLLSHEQQERNVLAFDTKGVVLWQIEKTPYKTEDTNPYGNIRFDGVKLIAGNVGGYKFTVDLKSGAVADYPPWPTRPW